MTHAADRALERYGLSLSTADLSDLACACRTGASVLVRRERRTNSEIRLVRFGDIVLVAVYDVVLDVIRTFSPPAAVLRGAAVRRMAGAQKNRHGSKRWKHRNKDGKVRREGRRTPRRGRVEENEEYLL